MRQRTIRFDSRTTSASDASDTVDRRRGYVIALVSARDRFHAAATEWEQRIRSDSIRIVTTRAVQFEIGSALSRVAWRSAGHALLQSMESDPAIEIVSIDEGLYRRALALFARSQRQGLESHGLPVVRRHGRPKLRAALTADEHFAQAGFEALLRE